MMASAAQGCVIAFAFRIGERVTVREINRLGVVVSLHVGRSSAIQYEVRW